ncbi:MAG: formylglycine-generating enzyme family protein [Lysobacter sp.]|nr:MAG: formylglycine-generating enzyme family protein [Lysobacter sp.]
MRAKGWIIMATSLALAACQDDRTAAKTPASPRAPTVVIGGDGVVSTWRPPQVEVTAANAAALASQADIALAQGRFVDDASGALPLFLALGRYPPMRTRAEAGIDHAVTGLLQQARTALARIDEETDALAAVRRAAGVLRVVALERADVQRFLQAVDRVEEGQRYALLGEQALARNEVGESGQGGSIGWFRRALALRATDARALQGLAAAESALIRRAETAASQEDYSAASRWLDLAMNVRTENAAVAQARASIAFQRGRRIGDLRDAGIAALSQPRGIEIARSHLAHLLRIALPGDAAGAELRRKIDFAVHYGAFEPGQRFTEALVDGGRGPRMAVVPHGHFRMGTPEGQADGSEAERPVRVVRFPRGLAVALAETTVGEFRRFVTATGYRPRSSRRGYSIIYDERSGNFVRRGNVDWTRDYRGLPAADDLPVVHVSAKDATAYAEWLAAQTGHRYRLPSEAEFEYALRAGSSSRYPWGDDGPPPGAGNFTGEGDRSSSGRRWQNAFPGYTDGAWGPTPVARFSSDRFGLHDMAGNVSEWVSDCWHASYRRAPRDARAWVNPGCRQRVLRGGSWASSPAQTRSAWRSGLDAETTNARIGFRVVRDL